jgi:1-acyl-sn-glycerol-3-phosphate acyltransferase
MAFAEHLNEFIAKWWYRLERIGPSRLPHAGPAIIASNHVCGADPILIGASSTHRPMTFLIAAEYAGWPIVRRVVKFLECIPVRRDTRETSATKQALRVLNEGKAMVIFIEGGIVGPGEPIRLKDGVATLALKTGAAVIPTYITGIKYHDSLLRSLFARHHARLRMGPPVDLSEFLGEPQTRDKIRAATRRIYDAILDLAPPEERAAKLAVLQRRSRDQEAPAPDELELRSDEGATPARDHGVEDEVRR